jgi:hypothetical protein
MTNDRGRPAAFPHHQSGRSARVPMEVTLMNVRKDLTDNLAKLAAVFVPAPAAPPRPITEDDLASDKYFQRVYRDRPVVGPEPRQPSRAA